MPRRPDIKSVLVIGSGPIVIGQACEFDYSGTQAIKALREEGLRVSLINSNPATIMTDPVFADRTYVEPLTPDTLARIIERERPDALLPTIGGQTALNLAVAVAENGTLEKFGVEMIGANLKSIKKAEDRKLFNEAMERIGQKVAGNGIAHNMDEAWATAERLGFPVIIRPAFTLGGTGGGVAYNRKEFEEIAASGLAASPIRQILIDESLLGWKEYELEVMRDHADNVVIICSIENLDPMGVHTGDSITVAPAQTLTDKEYQLMRNAAIDIIREIGVDTGGSNIQFAVSPANGEIRVIEMNPRVSRSSALASKATGFPIARIAAKLAIGYTLDELPNDITRTTPASFEPTIDYVVTKIPRFTFEKFPEADDRLTTQMKSVGEAMSIGRTFRESLQKALRSLEIGSAGFEAIPGKSEHEIEQGVRIASSKRLYFVAEAMRRGIGNETIHKWSAIDPWFLAHIRIIVESEGAIASLSTDDRQAQIRQRSGDAYELFVQAKRDGTSDKRIAALWNRSEREVRQLRADIGLRPQFKRVDTCAAEFESYTPYLYSSYEEADEPMPAPKADRVVVLGGGPNRIGQGIEFDYCCVHACFAIEEEGLESVMVNCNPETVSTDYDISTRLYFEPLTAEDVLEILRVEKPRGVILQFGGQTPLNLARELEHAGIPILGTSPASIDLAEDREQFQALLHKLGLRQPQNAIAYSTAEAMKAAEKIGLPLVVRPSFVLGGRAMRIIYQMADLEKYMNTAIDVGPGRPVLLDRFLEQATEYDVDIVYDGKRMLLGGIMQHIEEAGIHSGDSACSLPPYDTDPAIVAEIRRATEMLADALGVRGLMNVQYAVKDRHLYVLEVNPRASRTVPFVSKATGVALAKIATKVMLGRSLDDLGVTEASVQGFAVKEAVFPFNKFPNVDVLLGPEMKSTGEVMGIAPTFAAAFAKAELAAGTRLPLSGSILLSIADNDKRVLVGSAHRLARLGFELYGTPGTAKFLTDAGVAVRPVHKVGAERPNVVDMMKDGAFAMVVNTPVGAEAARASYDIRRTALTMGIPYFTTATAAIAATEAIASLQKQPLEQIALQDL